jgi:hypothetical protein
MYHLGDGAAQFHRDKDSPHHENIMYTQQIWLQVLRTAFGQMYFATAVAGRNDWVQALGAQIEWHEPPLSSGCLMTLFGSHEAVKDTNRD